jgi:ATPase subunit of ABC transporter with duplicated ATPase domains
MSKKEQRRLAQQQKQASSTNASASKGKGKGGNRRARNANDPNDDDGSNDDSDDDDDVRAARAELAKKHDWPEYVYLKGTSPLAPGMSKLRDVNVADVSVSVPGQQLLSGTRFKMTYGQRYGMVGRNGTGKSVLLKHVAHRLPPFEAVPKHIRIVYVEQEIDGDARSPLQTVLESDRERQWLLAEEQRFEDAAEKAEAGDHSVEIELERTLGYELRDVQERLHEIGSAKAEARASVILSGLGFGVGDMKRKPTSEYSGGWRMRVAIAQALFQEPEFLFLDEPTNHLDVVTAIWLEQYLAVWKKGLLVVSHDSEFLDGVVNNIIHLHASELTYYKGDYESFAKARKNRVRANVKQLSKQRKADARIKNLKQRGNAKLAKNKQRLNDRQGRVTEDREDPSLKFHFPDPGKIDYPMLTCNDVSFHYDGQPDIFVRLNFGIHDDSRIALIGPNGVGKTTLMQLMANRLKPSAGSVFMNPHLRVARFHQHHIDDLVMDDSAVELLRKRFDISEELVARKHLARFGLTGKLATKSIAKLSGGQKSRVAFASIAFQRPHLMLLDEPTNHLDMPMIESFARALSDFQGPVVLITHNQYLIEQVCNEIWLINFDDEEQNSTIERFDGSFDDYKRRIISTMPDFESYDF